MTTDTTTGPAVETVRLGHPRFTGANIRTWIGFKHFMYLVEEAILEWFRRQGQAPGRLYLEHGLGLEIVDSSVLLPAVLELDDEVTALVAPAAGGEPGRFSVRLLVTRDGREVSVLRGRVSVVLVAEKDPPGSAPAGALRPLVVAEAGGGGPGTAITGDVAATLTPHGSTALLWSWRTAYQHCHYSDRVQHSAYVAALEDVVERFLADRGISVRRMLAERAWIPVVSRARVTLLADVHMEETVHTTFVVTDVLRGTTFDGRMDCYVRRGDRLVHTATATILHGYAVSRGPGAGRLAELDAPTVAALTGGPARR
nr:hypothetical protein GCM10020063_037230 [Dactylosporangium thailandense]